MCTLGLTCTIAIAGLDCPVFAARRLDKRDMCGANFSAVALTETGGFTYAVAQPFFLADFLKPHPASTILSSLHANGLYRHSHQPGAPILCDFGVEVTRSFAIAGEVFATETPEGEAAVAVYRGPYDRQEDAYSAIDEWMAANRKESAGHSWEIYGDPTPDPAQIEPDEGVA